MSEPYEVVSVSRFFVVLLCSGVVGAFVGFLSLKHSRPHNKPFLWVGLAAALALIAGCAVQATAPVLYEGFFGWSAMTTQLRCPEPAVVLVAANPLLYMLGFAIGFVTVGVTPSSRSWKLLAPLATFAAVFVGLWYTQTEHLSSGVTTVTTVTRFDDVDNPGWDARSNEWLKFAYANMYPGVAFDSYSPSAFETLTGDTLADGQSGFLFRKLYVKQGKVVGTVQTKHVGPLSAAEIEQNLCTIFKARTSAR